MRDLVLHLQTLPGSSPGSSGLSARWGKPWMSVLLRQQNRAALPEAAGSPSQGSPNLPSKSHAP